MGGGKKAKKTGFLRQSYNNAKKGKHKTQPYTIHIPASSPKSKNDVKFVFGGIVFWEKGKCVPVFFDTRIKCQTLKKNTVEIWVCFVPCSKLFWPIIRKP
uniref:Uncharacterized protein n=1 Tax=Proboscia inermis TaxID=420281 RepID=A0A7S0CK86_9STRA|mmetsp:Transcript_50155/g.50511  ORF Transcript_50155/g.50511 Transcript_50155/m.50511 type:complete len:100 (+) Transcript_50155:270-569(+)